MKTALDKVVKFIVPGYIALLVAGIPLCLFIEMLIDNHLDGRLPAGTTLEIKLAIMVGAALAALCALVLILRESGKWQAFAFVLHALFLLSILPALYHLYQYLRVAHPPEWPFPDIRLRAVTGTMLLAYLIIPAYIIVILVFNALKRESKSAS